MNQGRIWVCPDCGAQFDTLGNGAMRFCPVCRDKQKERERLYWENKSAGMRSVASDIVSKILAKEK